MRTKSKINQDSIMLVNSCCLKNKSDCLLYYCSITYFGLIWVIIHQPVSKPCL